MVTLPDLLLPKKKYFGLSIERTSVNGVELDEVGRIIKSASVQIPQDTFIDGRLSKPNILSQAIKSVYETGKFSTPYVSVCFPEVFAYTRGCTIPVIPIDEVQEAISWRAKDLFPFPQSDIYFDWKILEKTPTEIHTIVVAVVRKLLDELVEVLVAIGLKPLRFEPDASAVVRLLHIHSDAHALLVEVNPKGAYVTLVEGEKAVFTTVINNTPQDTPASYLSNINASLVEIADFYKNKGVLKDASTQVIVTGEMASNEWAVHLGTILKYPAKILVASMSRQIYNKAYAAAVQKIAPPIDEQSINLLPTDTQSFYDAERDMQLYKTLLLRFSILIGFTGLVAAGAYTGAYVIRGRVDTQVKDIRSLTQSQQADTQALLLLNAQAKNITSLAPLRTTPKNKIQVLGRLAGGEGINITQWEYDDAKLGFKISGIATSRETLLKFKEALDISEDFANVILPLESLETPVNVPFVITFLVKG